MTIHLCGDLRVSIRLYDPETDAPVVLDSWTRQARQMPPCAQMDQREFNSHRRLLADLALLRDTCIACHPEHAEQVFGWLCTWAGRGEERVLGMVYVRSLWRQRGVATLLLRHAFGSLGDAPIYYTHETRATRHHRQRWRLRHNPYLVESIR